MNQQILARKNSRSEKQAKNIELTGKSHSHT